MQVAPGEAPRSGFLWVVCNNSARNALTKILRPSRAEFTGLSNNDTVSKTEAESVDPAASIFVSQALAALTAVERQVVTLYLGLENEAIKDFEDTEDCWYRSGTGEEELAGAMAKLTRITGGKK